jgi:hypothetical protein
MEILAAKKRYALVRAETHGVNASFVRDDLLPGTEPPTGPSAARHTANYFGTRAGHPRDPQNRPWVDLQAGGRLVRLAGEYVWPVRRLDLGKRHAQAAAAIEARLLALEELVERAPR